MIINWGDAPFKAYITVKYPSGTCTCALDSTTFTHTGGGTTTFIVNKRGTWTITGTDGNGVATTSSVTVSQMNETKSITLSYTLYIVNGRTIHSAVGSLVKLGIKTNEYEQTWTPVVSSGSGYTRFTNGDGWESGSYPAGVVYSSNRLDLTGYKSLIANGKVYVEKANTNINFGILSSKPTSSSCSFSKVHTASAGGSADRTFTLSGTTLNISSLNGKYYIGLMRGYNKGYVDFTSLRLES